MKWTTRELVAAAVESKMFDFPSYVRQLTVTKVGVFAKEWSTHVRYSAEHVGLA